MQPLLGQISRETSGAAQIEQVSRGDGEDGVNNDDRDDVESRRL